METKSEEERFVYVTEWCTNLADSCRRKQWPLFDKIPNKILWNVYNYSQSPEHWSTLAGTELISQQQFEGSWIETSDNIITKIGMGWRGIAVHSRLNEPSDYYTKEEAPRHLIPRPTGWCGQWRFKICRCETGKINFRILDWCDRYHLKETEHCDFKDYKDLFKTGDTVEISIMVKEGQGVIVIKKNDKRYSSYIYQFKPHNECCACNRVRILYLYVISVWLYHDLDEVKLIFCRYIMD